jgi:hypothetical protein
MNTATEESINNNNTKRLRIDPSAFLQSKTTMTSPTRSNHSTDDPAATTRTTPSAAALRHIECHSESLFPQLQPILRRLAKPHLKLLILRQQKIDSIARFDKAITIAMNPTDHPGIHPQWPKPANLKFQLKALKLINDTPHKLCLYLFALTFFAFTTL